jgi:arabinofuranan 3-O-arabinosyltransferase
VLPALGRSPDWQHLDTTFRVDPGTRRLFLYLYADGGAAERTAVDYRAATLQPTLSTVLVASQADVVGPPSTTTAISLASRPDRFRVRVRELGGTRLLVLADSYAAGWHLDGLPDGWHATHVIADGYANGWILTGDGDATLTLAYQPAMLGYLAEFVSAGTAGRLALGGLVGLVGVFRRGGVPRRRRPATQVIL